MSSRRRSTCWALVSVQFPTAHGSTSRWPVLQLLHSAACLILQACELAVASHFLRAAKYRTLDMQAIASASLMRIGQARAVAKRVEILVMPAALRHPLAGISNKCRFMLQQERALRYALHTVPGL